MRILRTLEPASIDAVITDPPYGIGFMGCGWDTFKPTEGAPTDPRRIPGVDPALGRRRAAGLEARRQLAGRRLATDRAPRRLRPRGRRTAHRHHGPLALRPGLPQRVAAWPPASTRNSSPPGNRSSSRAPPRPTRQRPLTPGTGPEDSTSTPACSTRRPATGTGAKTTGPTGRPARATKAASPPAGPAATAAGRPTRRWTPRPPWYSTNRPETAASGGFPTQRNAPKFNVVYGRFNGQNGVPAGRGRTTGGASRFFYCPKASHAERDCGLRPDSQAAGSEAREPINDHETVKPVELMRWLVRLAAPPNGVVLDPFAGSGSTGVACLLEERSFRGSRTGREVRRDRPRAHRRRKQRRASSDAVHMPHSRGIRSDPMPSNDTSDRPVLTLIAGAPYSGRNRWRTAQDEQTPRNRVRHRRHAQRARRQRTGLGELDSEVHRHQRARKHRCRDPGLGVQEPDRRDGRAPANRPLLRTAHDTGQRPAG